MSAIFGKDCTWAPREGWEHQGSDAPCIWCGKPKSAHEKHLPPPTKRDKLYPILFWGHAFERSQSDSERGINVLVDAAVALFTGKLPSLQPQQCVRTDISREKRVIAAKILSSGKVLERCYGFANCRICGVELGTADLYDHGMVWPEKSEHYVLEHDVWVPGLDRLIERSGN